MTINARNSIAIISCALLFCGLEARLYFATPTSGDAMLIAFLTCFIGFMLAFFLGKIEMPESEEKTGDEEKPVEEKPAFLCPGSKSYGRVEKAIAFVVFILVVVVFALGLY